MFDDIEKRKLLKIVKNRLRLTHKHDDEILNIHIDAAIHYLKSKISKEMQENAKKSLQSPLIMHIMSLYEEDVTIHKLEIIDSFYLNFYSYKL